MRRILLTTDLSDSAAQAYAPTIELARAVGAEVELLHVVEDQLAFPHGAPLAPRQSPPDLHRERAAAEERLAALGRELEVPTVLIVNDDVADAVAEYAAEHDHDLIAMATHGRSGWRRLLIGSVTEQVLRRARVPVITFPCARED